MHELSDNYFETIAYSTNNFVDAQMNSFFFRQSINGSICNENYTNVSSNFTSFPDPF